MEVKLNVAVSAADLFAELIAPAVADIEACTGRRLTPLELANVCYRQALPNGRFAHTQIQTCTPARHYTYTVRCGRTTRHISYLLRPTTANTVALTYREWQEASGRLRQRWYGVVNRLLGRLRRHRIIRELDALEAGVAGGHRTHHSVA